MTSLNVVTTNELIQKDIEGYFPILLKVENSDISWTEEEKSVYKQNDGEICLICDENTVIYKGKTYLPCSFSAQLPENDSSKIGSATISITALDVRVKKLLRSIKTESEIEFIAMFCKCDKKDSSGFLFKYIPLKLAKFTITMASVANGTASFRLTFDKALSQVIPYFVATQDRVPATKG